MKGFKDIKGFEGIYRINSKGDILRLSHSWYNNGSLVNVEPYIISVSEDSSGYLKATLRDSKGNKSAPKVHKLVMLTFVGQREEKMTINHKDGNKLNNSVENLEYVTHQDNVIHAYNTGLNNNYADKHVNSKLTTEKVLQMRADSINTNEYYVKKFKVDAGTISRARSGKSWKRI